MSTGLRFTLEVDGLPPDAFAVVSFHLNQSLSSLFSLDLSLVSQQFLSLEFAQVLDKMAYLTIWQGDEVQRRVKGVVTWFELGENDKNQMLYSMKVHPPLWRAGLRQNFRIFQNEDIKSILGTMLQENGVTEWSPLFSEPHPSREFCVQYGETDYDFLCRMAAEEGIFFYEEHAYKSTDQSLVLCDTVRHLPESFEIPWNPNTRTEVSTLCISQFRYSAQSFTPLIRVETENGEREKAQRRSLAETLQQEGSENGHGVVFPAELVRLLDRLEEEIRADRVSSESRAWLAQCGLTVEQLARQVEPEYTPARKVHFYHCDHRGLPLALISEDGNTAWRGEYDEWGNQLNEENPHHLHQPYRLPGQQHDEESGLYYNRHRHYDPLQGRYITPDPIGLRGGWNMYQYPLNPIQVIDPMGLDAIENMTSGGLIYAVSGVPGLIAANSITNSAYQFGYDMDAIVGGAHNGAADAMRHCYLMCRMTKTFGSTIADVIGKNHEAAGDRQGQPAKERIMVLKNNTVGIACGDFSAKCSDACIEKYNTGQLFGLDGIKADNPIKAKQGSSDASNY
ncbi:type VI secretion system tip protein TssI/VgrG [Escherichia coli]|uniref:type VI secretion system tip protein TssI/VgrG n=2 Tax=Escherichia coli TaxID=562 RepID=UPI000DA48181|nr:type VI secretion system tip protein TssI/VgrG [Escherichia coli]SQK58669.1 rhsE element core protein RshE [Escherichia coli]SQP39162.1 rhsE element core protein RshE [Escherichia coli]HAX6867837.1 type VI secretion system tip protein VgrG [Escherichia coli]